MNQLAVSEVSHSTTHCNPYVSSLSFAEVFCGMLSFPRLHVSGNRLWVILQSRKVKTVRCQHFFVQLSMDPQPHLKGLLNPTALLKTGLITWGKAMLVWIKTNTHQGEHRKWELQTTKISNLQWSIIQVLEFWSDQEEPSPTWNVSKWQPLGGLSLNTLKLKGRGVGKTDKKEYAVSEAGKMQPCPCYLIWWCYV